MSENKKSDRDIRGAILEIVAKVECGFCGLRFLVTVDPVKQTEPCGTVFDIVEFTVRGGNDWSWDRGQIVPDSPGHFTSVQGGYLLCPHCTDKVDEGTGEEGATREEVERVLGHGDEG